MIFCGADPGLSGAWAVMTVRDGKAPTVEVWDVPTFTITKNKGKRREYDIQGMRGLLQEALDRRRSPDEPIMAIVEKVQPMPRDSCSGITNFGLGLSLGVWSALLVGMEIPYTLVHPATWKRRMGVTAEKDTSRMRAMQLFPALAGRLQRKSDSDRAEAALLAYYGVSAQNGYGFMNLSGVAEYGRNLESGRAQFELRGE